MNQKTIIAILAAALVAVSSIFAYVLWDKRQPPAGGVGAVPATAAGSPTTPTPAAAASAVAAADAQGALPAFDSDAAMDTASEQLQDSPETDPADSSDQRGGVAFTYEYVAPKTPALTPVYELARDSDLFKRIPELIAIDGKLMLPDALHVVAAECQQANALYSPAKHELVLCYELIAMLLEQGSQVAEANKLESKFPVRFLLANLRFIMLHELGHGLIDMLKLTATGREEDSADQLAATLMLQNVDLDETPGEIAENLRIAALFFKLNAQSQYSAQEYADEHSLGEQRFYNLICILYGSDPARYVGVVTSGSLPESRAVRCGDESKRITTAWTALLEPHIAAEYRLTAEQQAQQAEERKRRQSESAASPYVR